MISRLKYLTFKKIKFPGLLLHNESFLFRSTTEWIFAGIISFLGLFGNVLMLKILTLKEDKTRNGWTDQARFAAAVTLAVVARSALETTIVSAINFCQFCSDPIAIEDGIGIALLLSVGLFCCFVKPVDRNLSNQVISQSSTNSVSL